MSTRSNAEPRFVGLFRRLSAVLPVKLNRRRGASGTEEELNCQAGGRQVWTVLLLSCTLCTTITADRTRLEMKQKKFGEGNREEILKKTSKKRRKRRRRIKHYIYTPPSPYVASMASIHVSPQPPPTRSPSVRMSVPPSIRLTHTHTHTHTHKSPRHRTVSSTYVCRSTYSSSILPSPSPNPSLPPSLTASQPNNKPTRHAPFGQVSPSVRPFCPTATAAPPPPPPHKTSQPSPA
ncbi:hypothetical protein BKA81DRAFT_43164 [Phyllosticta paracitricarpa]